MYLGSDSYWGCSVIGGVKSRWHLKQMAFDPGALKHVVIGIPPIPQLVHLTFKYDYNML